MFVDIGGSTVSVAIVSVQSKSVVENGRDTSRNSNKRKLKLVHWTAVVLQTFLPRFASSCPNF